jgi:hypothetical protein
MDASGSCTVGKPEGAFDLGAVGVDAWRRCMGPQVQIEHSSRGMPRQCSPHEEREGVLQHAEGANVACMLGERVAATVVCVLFVKVQCRLCGRCTVVVSGDQILRIFKATIATP